MEPNDLEIEPESKNRPHVITDLGQLPDILGDRIISCVTGIRPSGRLHIGHYVGALKNWLEMQKSPNVRCHFLIADYQVLGDHLGETEKLRSAVVDSVIDWLALGLDPEKSDFIVQSYVPEFAELFNFLTMFVPYSLATNNPTLKDEMRKIESRESSANNTVSLGFVNYPVSQVADIMLLRGDIVPVGEDQIPHIELTRKIVKRVNTMCKTNFPLPIALISNTPRLVGTDGNEKMSKSLGNTIYLTSTNKEIKAQVQKMYTDPGKIGIADKGNIEKHAVFAYLDIFYGDKAHLAELKKRYVEGGENSVGDGELKKLLVETLEALIAPIRERREHFEKHPELVVAAIENGAKRARAEGEKMLRELKSAIGVLDYGK